MNLPEVKLSYFDTRGRGQFIRYFLRYRKIPFDDDRIPLSPDFREWAAIRDDRRISGPFHKLPVLHWGDTLISETMVIHTFLHNESGDVNKLSTEDNYRHAMLGSSLYGDLMLPVGTMIWSDILYEGLDLKIAVNKTLDRIRGQLQSLEKSMGEWSWLENLDNRPLTITDCLMWEELDVIKHVFRDHVSFENTALLNDYYRECPGLDVFRKVLSEHPVRITGRPAEAEAIARIHEILDD